MAIQVDESTASGGLLRRIQERRNCFSTGCDTLPAMKLAKQHLDVGLFSTKRDEQLAFWQQTVGLRYDHMGKVGGGVQQHRHHMNGSILKMNHSRDPLPDVPPSGIVGLGIARDGLRAEQTLADPDGNKVILVPKGAHGVEGIAILLKVNDPAAHDRFWTHACSSNAPATAAIAAATRWSWSRNAARSSIAATMSEDRGAARAIAT